MPENRGVLMVVPGKDTVRIGENKTICREVAAHGNDARFLVRKTRIGEREIFSQKINGHDLRTPPKRASPYRPDTPANLLTRLTAFKA